MVVRNEADLLPVNVRYHAAQGVTEFRIVDNGSSDATTTRLRELSRSFRILWTRDDGPYHQSEIVTGLAREACRAGADWIVPIDADEFWSAGSRCLAQALEASTAGAIEAKVVNFVQDRGSRDRGDTALLTMTSRVAAPHPYQQWRELMESGRMAFVELEYPPKWLPRASPDLQILAGAHGVDGTVSARAVLVRDRLSSCAYPIEGGPGCPRGAWTAAGRRRVSTASWLAQSAVVSAPGRGKARGRMACQLDRRWASRPGPTADAGSLRSQPERRRAAMDRRRLTDR